MKRRFQVLFNKSEAEAELDDELRFHLEKEIELNLSAGMSQAEARRRALVAFGGVERHKEEVRHVRGARVLDDAVQDTRIAFRSFMKEPAFLAAVLLTLGLGIGGNVAMFGILEASLFRALPYPEPDRLVMGRVTWNGQVGQTVSGPDFFDYRERSGSFERLAAFTPWSMPQTLTGEGEPDRVPSIFVSPGFFAALGAVPVLGREFAPDEGELGGPNVVVISEGLWERRFGSDPDILGRGVTFGGTPSTVVGVMPASFRLMADVDAWFPLQRGGAWAGGRQFHNFILVGRLAPGVSMAQAQEDVDRISAALAEEYPDTNRDKGLNVAPLKEALSQRYETTLMVLMAAVATLLLIACGNVAGLLLARGSARRGELAVRSVMGAGQGRLARQLVTENALLAVGAGLVGVAMATGLQRGILSFVSLDLLGRVEPGLSGPSLGFALGLSALTVVAFGVIPALRLAGGDPAADLRSGARATGGRGATRFRNGLVVAQVALTAVLLSGAGLLLRSFSELQGVDPGFDDAHLLTAAVQIPSAEYQEPAARVEFFRQLSERIAAAPGVQKVGFTTHVPIRDPGGNVRVDRPELFGTAGVFGRLAYRRAVMPGYFDALGIPLRAGRDVALTDDPAAPRVIVLSQSLAEQIFPGENPLGRTVGVDQGGSEPATFEVVGVVGDVVPSHPAEGMEAAMYVPYSQSAGSRMSLAVRATDLAAAATAVRGVLREMDPDIPLAEAATMDEVESRVVADQRSMAAVLSAFAAVALLLAAVGLYGVLAYQVSRRLHEIGIRMALGADAGRMVSSVVRGGMTLVVVGLLVGLPVSYFAARLIREMLFGVGTGDPLTYAGVAVFLGGVAALACALPGFRASRVDPAVAFREE
ncbi:MAG TPA: ABC transporter permease [Longimicrobiales bacterium]|nr:ABC transporter permease [Longimicrobiales bacterium]